LSGPTGRDTRKGLKKMVDKKKIFFCLHFLLCPFKKIFFLSTIVALCATMVRSSGSNNCSIRRIEPWTGRDNRFKVFQRKTYLSFKKYGQKGTLGQVRKLVSLPFHPFSSLFFFLKKKRAEKGRKRQGRDTRLENFFKKVNKRNIYIKKGRNTRITLRFSLLWYIFIILSFYIFLFIMADIA